MQKPFPNFSEKASQELLLLDRIVVFEQFYDVFPII